jgi:hypothetical protein
VRAFLFSALFFATHSGALAGFSLDETYLLDRDDGSQITYYLQRPEKEGVPVLLGLQGSQYTSMFDHSFASARVPEEFGAAFLMVEKPGVSRGSNECTSEYRQRNSIRNRVKDIKRVLSHLEEQSWWNGELLLLGGFEGGDVAVRLSELLHVKKAALLVTGAGMTMAESLPFFIRASAEGDAPEEWI